MSGCGENPDTAGPLTAALLSSALILAALVGPGYLGAQEPDSLVQAIPGTDVAFVMVRTPGGTFLLGSPEGEAGRDPDEGPRRTVALEPFWIGVHEVTSDEFAVYRNRNLDSPATSDSDRRLDVDAVSRPSPPYEDPAHGMGGGDRPATGMTHWGALNYARWLSMKTGRLYRLPTEAEWEYACRAGGTMPAPDLEARAWYIANSGERTHPVGLKAANDWGIHDMLGNVAEWTMDHYREGFYAEIADPVDSPWARSPDRGPRTVRGGAFDDDEMELRCAARVPSSPRWQRRDPQIPKSRWWNTDAPHVGFRLVSPDRSHTLAEIEAFWRDVLGS